MGPLGAKCIHRATGFSSPPNIQMPESSSSGSLPQVLRHFQGFRTSLILLLQTASPLFYLHVFLHRGALNFSFLCLTAPLPNSLFTPTFLYRVYQICRLCPLCLAKWPQDSPKPTAESGGCISCVFRWSSCILDAGAPCCREYNIAGSRG